MRKNALLTILVVTLAVIATACDNQSPSGTVAAVFDCVKNKDYDKMTEYILFDTQDEGELKERRIQAASIYRAAYEKMEQSTDTIDNVTITGEQIAPDGKTATVSFKVIYTNGNEEPGEQTLVNSDGRWFYPDPLQPKSKTLAL